MQKSIGRKLEDLQRIAAENDAELVQALSVIDPSAIETKTPLRSLLEAQELKDLEDFVSKFTVLEDCLNNTLETLDKLDESCESILVKLSYDKSGVSEVIDMTSSLFEEQERKRRQLAEISEFLAHNYVSEDDIRQLSMGTFEESFFEASARLDSAISTASDNAVRNSGMAYMQASAELNKIRESTFQRIYQWLKLNSHIFDRPEPIVTSQYARMLEMIKRKPAIYGFIYDDIAKVRGKVVSSLFLKALITGDKDTPPIEDLQTTDPLQYAGDCFAWVHQATVSEALILSKVLQEADGGKVIKKCLATVFNSVVPPLDTRVSKAIKCMDKQEELDEFISLCNFFHTTFSETCGLTSQLTKCIGLLRAQADKAKRDLNTESEV